jgi:hypothetical protein
VWNNITLLLEPWFLDKVEQYSQLKPAERQAFLDRFLDRVDQWSGVDAICPKTSTHHAPRGESTPPHAERGEYDAGPPAGFVASLLARNGNCRQQADPAQRARIDAFVTAVEARWLWRKLFLRADSYRGLIFLGDGASTS